MTRKDVSTVQRRFKLFKKNWGEFQKKDLIVKKSVIVDDGATFKPQISKKSDSIIRDKEQGSMEFPMSNNAARSDQRGRRQKVWERELPRGVKSKERLDHKPDFLEQGINRGDWLHRTEHRLSGGGLPLYGVGNDRDDAGSRNGTALRNNLGGARQVESDYFALGSRELHQPTYASLSSRNSSRRSTLSKGRKALTNPQLTQRVE